MKSLRTSLLLVLSVFLLMPAGVFAATATKTTAAKKVVIPAPKLKPLEFYGWIPYWRTATGTADVLPHLSQMSGVSPFVFTLKTDGSLYDSGHLSEEPWASFIATAKQKKVRIIPTVMWSSGETIHAVLSNTKTRIALEDTIANMVKQNGFDGIDIDFEGKKAETKPYFSLFLKGLYQRMGKKWVYCTIEARTPLASRYDTIPVDIQYANDFAQINKYCDRVNIMAYDQGTIDLRLNEIANGPYIPVADPKWVEKVVTLAAQSIAKNKIMIGVPSYGYEYQFKALSEEGYRYDLEWAFNPRYATELAASLGITPTRNSAGELSFMYMPTSTMPVAPSVQNGISVDATMTNNVDVSTSSFSTATSSVPVMAPPMNILWWSDAKAIADKVALARKLGVRGVSVFKLDGGEDPAMWNVLK